MDTSRQTQALDMIWALSFIPGIYEWKLIRQKSEKWRRSWAGGGMLEELPHVDVLVLVLIKLHELLKEC